MDLTITPTVKQELVYNALSNPKIDVIFFGGAAGGGKSWVLCESRLANCYQYPGYRSFIGREELKRLMQSTYVTWQKVCQYHKIPQEDWHLNGQYNYIEFYNGSRVDLLDLKFLPTDPLYERLGSLEYTDGAIEEAGEIDFLAYDVLKSRIGRQKNREYNIHPNILITGNPKKNWTYTQFYKPWKEKCLSSNFVFIQSLFSDNPYTAEEYGKQLALITDKQTKERLMNGNWEYDDDPNALIEYDNIIDLFTNPIQENNDRYLIADIARYGSDKTTISLWNGLICYKQEELKGAGIDVVSNKIKRYSLEERIPYSHIAVDEDGIGGGVVDTIRGIRGFVANTRPFDNKTTHQPENYQNLKAQCSYKLAEMVNDHKMRINCDNQAIKTAIIEELEQIKSKDKDKDGKLKIIPKEEVKELIGRSPDWSDNLMMRMLFEVSAPISSYAIVNRPKFNKSGYN